jgi:hypothetical protein
MRLHVWLVVGALLVASGALAQERALQMGTKTSDAGYAVGVDVTIALDDMAKAGETFEKAFDNLATMAEAEGFTMLGPTRIVLKSMGPTADQKMPFQLQMLIIQQPTDEDLKAQLGFALVKLEPQKVAFTYHKGTLDQIQMSFMGLMTWVQQNGLQFAGLPWIVIYPTAEGGEPQVCEIQAPVQ